MAATNNLSNIRTFNKGQSMTDKPAGLNQAIEPFTAIPNYIDEAITVHSKTLAEIKIVKVVIRKTLGYHKTWDSISFTQFQELTHMSPQGVNNGIQSALDRGFIVRLQKGQYWEYSLNYSFFETFKTTPQSGVVTDEPLNSMEYQPLQDVELQKKDLNKTTDTNVSGEINSPTTPSNILEFTLTDSPPDKASQSSFFSEPIPVDLEAKRVSRVKAQKAKPEKKTRNVPAWQDLPQFVIWRKYANLKHYKAWPNLQEREAIIKHIPPDEDNLERWEGLIQIWLDREHNFKIFNVDGLVDVFVNGWREKSYSRKGRY